MSIARNSRQPPPFNNPDKASLAWVVLLIFGAAVYALGLGGQYIPTNGDELVYTHIARMTAATGHWLPLASDLDHMRNTKPPLLFWQALVAGDWGQRWTIDALRAPSVLYTLMTTVLLALTVQRISSRLDTALIAACAYLAFFCTFRYGRPFLTSAPETFWLNLPLWLLLLRHTAPPGTRPDRSPGWVAHAGFGLAMGLGLAYKSFALIAPAAATLWCALLLHTPPTALRNLLGTSLRVVFSAAVALGIFGLWFALDPDPASVWREFVVGENAGKMSSSKGYWHVALAGGGASIWAQLLGYAQNAGLLAFAVLGLMALGTRQWRQAVRAPVAVKIMLVWLVVWLLVFTIPSQRSARYLIPAMPALAMLMALYWQRLSRAWFIPSLLLCTLLALGLARISWATHALGIAETPELLMTLAMSGLILGLTVAGLVRANWTRACALAACLAVYACFGLCTAPLNGAAGTYSVSVTSQLQAQRIAVPNNFNGEFERFEFLLPGNRFLPYGSASTPQLSALLAQHDAVAWLQTQPGQAQPECLPQCRVLGTRWEVKGRHQAGEITLGNIAYPEQWLFRREWLLKRTPD
jgi:4-amino-4-deoxy-L-arabinose transferase-like glycosyltransferase